MSKNIATRFQVEYTFRTSPNGSSMNTSLSASASQLGAMPIRSETAVLSFLRRKHPGCDVTVRNINWYNMFNEQI